MAETMTPTASPSVRTAAHFIALMRFGYRRRIAAASLSNRSRAMETPKIRCHCDRIASVRSL
jgi:hypothetical protein